MGGVQARKHERTRPPHTPWRRTRRYTLKVQEVRRGRGGREERRTVGKVALDMARFCSSEVEPLPQEVFLQLRWGAGAWE